VLNINKINKISSILILLIDIKSIIGEISITPISNKFIFEESSAKAGDVAKEIIRRLNQNLIRFVFVILGIIL
jgi:hypothetical protein